MTLAADFTPDAEPAAAAAAAEMGFFHGWGAALDQLVELVRSEA